MGLLKVLTAYYLSTSRSISRFPPRNSFRASFVCSSMLGFFFPNENMVNGLSEGCGSGKLSDSAGDDKLLWMLSQ